MNPDLVFTGECQDDFEKGRLPMSTLDFEIWEEDKLLLHSYYQKPTKNPYQIMEPWDSRYPLMS